jgi:peptide/nickel transport system substrate-binding protein
VRLVREDGIFVRYLSYDLAHDVSPSCPGSKNPFRIRAVREAMSVAIDRRTLVSRLPTYAIPSWQMAPASIFGFNPDLAKPPHDPARARRLLAGAGFPKGFTVTLHVRRIFADAVPPLVEMLGAVGIRVVPSLLSDEEYFDLVDKRHASCFFLSRFGCPTGDVSDILDNGVHTPDAARHLGAQNYGEYSDPALDRKIEESAATLDMERRRPILSDILADVSREIVWIPLYVEQNVFLYRERLTFAPRADEFVLAAGIGLSGSR